MILFDEIEKAHPEIQRIFLQIFDDGHLTDSKGMTVSFSHSTIIMTTNLGARELDPEEIRNLAPQEAAEYVRKRIEPVVKEFFSPEFLNRLNGIHYFRPLSPDIVQKIARKKVEGILTRVSTPTRSSQRSVKQTPASAPQLVKPFRIEACLTVAQVWWYT